MGEPLDCSLEIEVAREAVRARLFPELARHPTFGRYKLLSRLGEGGMGLVFAGYDPELEREVAVKVLRPSASVGVETSARDRLLREARSIARLSHPNVVSIYDVGEEDGRVFVVMELVRGSSLQEWMRAPRKRSELIAALVDAGRGLAAAHSAGLVHRDFKPGNVLIGQDGRARVADFGLARVCESGGELDSAAIQDAAVARDLTLTRSGAVLGTPAYLSPEQCLGAPADHRADQFAFCVCLFEAAFGQRPFNASDFAELRRAIVSSPVEPPATARAHSQEFVSALLRGLSKRPQDRFESMGELLAVLHRCTVTADVPSRSGADGVKTSPPSHGTAGGILQDYLSGLPAGLDSHPQCLVRTAVVRHLLGASPVPSSAPRDLALCVAETMRVAWAPAVHVQAMFAAIADARPTDAGELDQLFLRACRAQCASGFFRFMVPPLTSPRLMGFVARMWNAAHLGMDLTVEQLGAGQAQLALRFSPGLLSAVGCVELIQWLSASLEMAGATLFDGRVLERTDTCCLVEVRWA